MKVYLERKGYSYSNTTVHKYMNTELGLRSVVRPKKPGYGKGQILRPTPNTAPLICGACYNTQPEDLLTMA